MTVSDEVVDDIRHAYARVSGEESLRTPRGTRPIDALSINLEWTHGREEPALRVVGLPLFARTGAPGRSDYLARNFRLSDYGPEGVDLPRWIKDFCARHDPNPPQPRVWRRGDDEPPADVVLLMTANLVEGARYLRRTPEGGWWLVEFANEATDPEGYPWSLVWSDDSDPGALTEVPVEQRPEEGAETPFLEIAGRP